MSHNLATDGNTLRHHFADKREALALQAAEAIETAGLYQMVGDTQMVDLYMSEARDTLNHIARLAALGVA